ncbi:MAG: diacylglycerol kinase, partial [Paracoccaceae bacterium]|nr:diacylglycerol kinase [Paracoccaceae bacterium]
VGGLRRLWTEAAFRHELLAAAVILGLLIYLQVAAVKFLIFGLLLLLLIAVEALNTAIESITDHISPEWAAFARDAKDLGSLAVMCLLVAHGAFLVYVFFD